MNISGYIKVAGEESPINYLKQHLDFEGVTVKHLIKVQKEFSITGTAAPWVWETASKEFSPQDLDSEMQQLLFLFSEKFLVIKSSIPDAIYIEMQLVVKYEDGDSPFGVSLSKETIKLLSDIDAALDVDSISYLRNI